MQEAFFTPFMGSAQRLPNGNTLLCEAAFGRLIEVTAADDTVWEYVAPYFAEDPYPEGRKMWPGESNALFRATKYGKDEIPWL